MAKTKIKIEWRNEASIQFYEILDYLNEESEKAVSIVGNAILDEIESLIIFPTKHPPDRFKKNNDGNFKAEMKEALQKLEDETKKSNLKWKEQNDK